MSSSVVAGSVITLRVPPALIQSCKDKHKSAVSDSDWHQCDIVDCGRWYQRMRQVLGFFVLECYYLTVQRSAMLLLYRSYTVYLNILSASYV